MTNHIEKVHTNKTTCATCTRKFPSNTYSDIRRMQIRKYETNAIRHSVTFSSLNAVSIPSMQDKEFLQKWNWINQFILRF